MRRILVIFVVATLVGTACADSTDVATLVKRLGDPKFAVREAAQRELLNRGERIVPELDRLAKSSDAETAERLRKIRYELVGYKDDIRRLLTEVHEGKDSASVPVSAELRGLIANHQPGGGDVLLSILADRKHALYRRALRAFVSTWDVATPDQVDRYLQQSVALVTNHRPKFPAKVGAMISFDAQIRDGWTGWPPIGGMKLEFDFRCRTTRYIDGKPYEKPFECQYPFATVGWYKVGALSEGKHTINAVMEYEFTQRGEKRKGSIRSSESTFEVTSADTPDELIAAPSEQLTKRVRSGLLIGETENDVMLGGLPEIRFSQPAPDPWYPQVTWEGRPGKTAGVHCPVRMVREALDVDLCFEAEIEDVKTGSKFPADPVIVRQGQYGRNWIIPREARKFAQDRDGFVKVKVVLKPSRALALSDPRIAKYFGETIRTGELRMKIWQEVPPSPIYDR